MAYPVVQDSMGSAEGLAVRPNLNSPSSGNAHRPIRRDVEFRSGRDICRAWLYLPDSPAPAPVIVMAHGLGGTRNMRLDAYAERFRSAGYACVLFDYRHFGASDGLPRQLLDIRLQQEDWAAAIQFARGLDIVDPTMLILWGTSFAGGHVLAAAAGDGTVSAVISQNPFTDGIASVLAIKIGTTLKVTLRALRDVIGSWFGRAPVMIPLAGKPEETALMTAPDVWGGFVRMHPEGEPKENFVAARIGLNIGLYRPGRYAAKLTCPVLFCICKNDSVAPANAALRYARHATRGEICINDAGHFDIYFGSGFEQAVAQQIAFLNSHFTVHNTIGEKPRDL